MLHKHPPLVAGKAQKYWKSLLQNKDLLGALLAAGGVTGGKSPMADGRGCLMLLCIPCLFYPLCASSSFALPNPLRGERRRSARTCFMEGQPQEPPASAAPAATSAFPASATAPPALPPPAMSQGMAEDDCDEAAAKEAPDEEWQSEPGEAPKRAPQQGTSTTWLSDHLLSRLLRGLSIVAGRIAAPTARTSDTRIAAGHRHVRELVGGRYLKPRRGIDFDEEEKSKKIPMCERCSRVISPVIVMHQQPPRRMAAASPSRAPAFLLESEWLAAIKQSAGTSHVSLILGSGSLEENTTLRCDFCTDHQRPEGHTIILRRRGEELYFLLDATSFCDQNGLDVNVQRFFCILTKDESVTEDDSIKKLQEKYFISKHANFAVARRIILVSLLRGPSNL
jgi:hypothetical protein